MKKVIVTIIASGLIASVSSAATSVTADFATAYVFRGITVVDDLVVQPGIEVDGFGWPEEYGSIALGAWGSTAPFEDSYNNMRETDWYVVYTLPELVTNLVLSIGFTEYQYVGDPGEQEINIGAAFALCDEVTIGGSANFMVDDENTATEDQIYVDLYAEYALEVSESLDASVGALIGIIEQGNGNDSDNGWDDGFNQYELHAAFGYAVNELWSIGGSLAYIGQLNDNVLTDSAYDRGLVAMFSIGCDM